MHCECIRHCSATPTLAAAAVDPEAALYAIPKAVAVSEGTSAA